MIRVISWETSKSRAGRRRWRELNESGVVTLRPEPARRFSRLHLQRGGLRPHMLCGLRRPEADDALVIAATPAELRRMGRMPEVRAVFASSHSGPCVQCAVEAAMDADHMLVASVTGAAVPSEATCACGWTMREFGEDPQEAHRAHVEQVVRDAILDASMTVAERRLFRALEAA